MAVFADIVDEWKKAGPKEKLLIVGGGAAVVALALYLHSKSSSSQTLAGTGTAGVGGSFQQPGPSGTGSTSAAPPASLPPPTFTGPPQPAPGPTKYSVYTVSPGESLNDIAYAFNLTPGQLEQMNPYLVNFCWTCPGAYAGHDVTVNSYLRGQAPVGNAPTKGAGPGPSSKQPTALTGVYANTRHGPPLSSLRTKQFQPTGQIANPPPPLRTR